MYDKGVRGDYVDRNFSGIDGDLKYRKKVMTRQQRNEYYDSLRRAKARETRKDLSEFKMFQEARPLKPPGKR